MKSIKAILITLSFIFSFAAVSESAFARKSLPSEVISVQSEVEPIGVALLQIALALGIVLGFAFLIPEKTRSTGWSLLIGTFGVGITLYIFTNHLNSLAAPLTGILTNTGRVSDLLKPSEG